MLYENICRFQRTSLQVPKDRERNMCKLKIKGRVAQYVIHEDAKCMIAHGSVHFIHRLAWGNIMFSL